MTTKQYYLIAVANVDAADEGTEWRDRMEAWLDEKQHGK